MVKKILILGAMSVIIFLMIGFYLMFLPFNKTSQEDFMDGFAMFESENYYKAAEKLIPMANDGFYPAYNFVAFLYATGNGVIKDDDLAIKYLDTNYSASLKYKLECPHFLFRSTLPLKVYALALSLKDIKNETSDVWFKKAKELGYEERFCPAIH